MNAPVKVGLSLAEACRIKRADLLQAFCALEIELSAALGPDAPKMFSQKVGRLTADQLARVDPKSLIASRNLVAHAHIVAASRGGTPISVWQVPHPERHLNARVMSRDELDEWYRTLTEEIERLRASVNSIR
ncbi:hypothetical protein [Sphingomonas sp.]|uniref:hypothetical protein n=1 Tax=Sphingomonas sp. TaxID=28214 RepID=UPI0025F9520B|nr:hypothetical protein [Sphingomonas sp.]